MIRKMMGITMIMTQKKIQDALPMLMDSPQCLWFGIFVIWWVDSSEPSNQDHQS